MLMDFDNCVLPCPYGYDRAVARTEKAGFQGAVAPWRDVGCPHFLPSFLGAGKKESCNSPYGYDEIVKVHQSDSCDRTKEEDNGDKDLWLDGRGLGRAGEF